MGYILKGLYYEYKIRAYEKGIMAIQRGRDKLKAKQAKATTSMEKYTELARVHKSNK